MIQKYCFLQHWFNGYNSLIHLSIIFEAAKNSTIHWWHLGLGGKGFIHIHVANEENHSLNQHKKGKLGSLFVWSPTKKRNLEITMVWKQTNSRWQKWREGFSSKFNVLNLSIVISSGFLVQIIIFVLHQVFTYLLLLGFLLLFLVLLFLFLLLLLILALDMDIKMDLKFWEIFLFLKIKILFVLSFYTQQSFIGNCERSYRLLGSDLEQIIWYFQCWMQKYQLSFAHVIF